VVHRHSPAFRNAILFLWTSGGIVVGALVINPENRILRYTIFGAFGEAPPRIPSNLPVIVGAVVGGICGLFSFAAGAVYVFQSKRELRWLVGGIIAFAAIVPATVLHYQLFPPAGPISGGRFLHSLMVCIPWVFVGLVWGIGWGMVENVVCHKSRHRTCAIVDAIPASGDRLEVVTRRLD